MMKPITTISTSIAAFLSLTSMVPAADPDPDEKAKAEEYAAFENRILHSSELTRNERLELLAGGIRKHSRHDGPESVLPIYPEALRQIVTIPGYAAYFADKIREGQRRILEGHGDVGGYELDQITVFHTLKMIPTWESVNELASFLDDIKGSHRDPYPNEKFGVDEPLQSCNAAFAVGALDELGLVGAPTNSEIVWPARQEKEVTIPERRSRYVNMEVDHPKWLKWWKEVKQGERTYRIKDSPVEYGAKGPESARQTPKISFPPKSDEPGHGH